MKMLEINYLLLLRKAVPFLGNLSQNTSIFFLICFLFAIKCIIIHFGKKIICIFMQFVQQTYCCFYTRKVNEVAAFSEKLIKKS